MEPGETGEVRMPVGRRVALGFLTERHLKRLQKRPLYADTFKPQLSGEQANTDRLINHYHAAFNGQHRITANRGGQAF